MYDWHIVRKGSKRCAKSKNVSYTTPNRLEKNPAVHSKAVQVTMERFQQSDLWVELQQKLNLCLFLYEKTIVPPGNLVQCSPWLICFGIGSGEIGDYQVFLSQLALALLLQKTFSIHQTKTWISDPIMSANDRVIISELGMTPDLSTIKCRSNICDTVTQSDAFQNDAYSASIPMRSFSHIFSSSSPDCCATISTDNQPLLSFPPDFADKNPSLIFLFIPHCDKPIYSESLRCIHYYLSPVPLVILIGNDLSRYDQLQVKQFYQDNPSVTLASCQYLDQIMPNIESIPITEVYEESPRAFNDLCISVIKPSHARK